jgi:propionyl-CoA carboxylase alpha chain
LTACRPPAAGRQGDALVRIDTGVVEGAEISMFYDPMIAKLITWAPTRAEAIAAQADALDRYFIRGISHNIDFLAAIMAHGRFQAGSNVTTGFIAEEYPDGFHGAPVDGDTRLAIAAAAGVVQAIEAERAQMIDGQLSGHGAEFGEDWVVELAGEQIPISVAGDASRFNVLVGDHDVDITTDWRVGEPLFTADIDGVARAMTIEKAGSGLKVTTRGASHRVRVLTPRAAELARHMIAKVPADMSRFLLCPMPGLVVSVAVGEGDKVEAGQQLATVEAMKMENILRAEKPGIIAKVHAKAGDSLAVDAVILEFAD